MYRIAYFLLMVSALSFGEDKGLPLQTDRTLSFSVSEATWLSLDLSPDDQTLVLEILGDLYTLPITGGKATPLLTRLAFDSQPVWSPDGRYIAYISDWSGDEELWIYTLATGEEVQLSDSNPRLNFASPSWSPDSKRVIVSQRAEELSTYEVWSYGLDGGAGVQITYAKSKQDLPLRRQHNALGAVLDPGQRFLYYARKSGSSGYNLSFPLWQIARRDLRYGNEDILTGAVGSAVRPVLSHDGKTLVYGTRHQHQTGLRIRDLAVGTDQWLAYPIVRDEQEARFTRDLLPGYAFTSDDRELLTTRNGKIIAIRIDDRSVREIPFSVDVELEVGRRTQFTRRIGVGPVRARVLGHPEISPDGRFAAFHAFTRIYRYEFATQETQALSPQGLNAAMPVWSPDGRSVAYVTWQAGEGSIYRQRARPGARPIRVTHNSAYYTEPVWSPDAERIFAMRGRSVEFERRESVWNQVTGAELIWVDSDGGPDHVVIPARGLSLPHFGPETDRVYLYIGVTPLPAQATMGLVSVRFDGTDRIEHLLVEGPGHYRSKDRGNPERMRISPTGQHVLIRHAHQLYLATPVPMLKNQKVKLDKPSIPLVQLTDVGADYMGFDAAGEQVFWTSGDRLFKRAIASIKFKRDDATGRNQSDRASQNLQTESPSPPVADANQATALREDDSANEVHNIWVYRPRAEVVAPLVLENATVFMGTELKPQSATVVVEGGRIALAGPGDEVMVPDNAHVIDLKDQFLLPGFIDTHAHYRVTAELIDAGPPSLLANLAYGVTTGLDVQPTTVSLISVKDNVDAGLTIGPRTFSTGPGVFNNNEFKSYEHALAVLGRYKNRYRLGTVKAYLSGSRKQRQWLVRAARELELNITTEGGSDLKMDLSLMIDGFTGIEHSLPQPRLYQDVVQLAGQMQLSYTPTLLVTYGGPFGENRFYAQANPFNDEKLRKFTPLDQLERRALRRTWFHPDEYVTDDVAASAWLIQQAGGQVGVGAHGQLQGLGYHWELWALARGGMKNIDALRIATIGGARMLGVERDLGSITQGKLADLVVLDADPTVDLANTLSLKFVIKGGVIYEAATLNEVWPDPSIRARGWWQRGNVEELP